MLDVVGPAWLRCSFGDMSTPLHIETVCKRGFTDAASLTPQERLVYLLADLEALKDMEGWDHFFTTSRMRYYRDLVAGLDAAGDFVSVEILQAYENHFSSCGVAFEAAAIAKFLSDVSEDFWSSSRDWETEFELAKQDRWNKVEEYLKRNGYEIVAEPGASPNGGPAKPLGNSGVSEGPPSVS